MVQDLITETDEHLENIVEVKFKQLMLNAIQIEEQEIVNSNVNPDQNPGQNLAPNPN